MKKLFIALNFLAISSLFGQVQSPETFLGYALGTQFSRHHQVIDYVKHVAAASAHAKTKSYGKTYEGRTLQLVYLSSPENLAQLEALRKDHLRSIGYETGARETTKEFSVVWLSYNVHGNESTSTEAAMKTLYTLVTEKQEWLENLVVIMDPCINPDGRDRYVNWYNQVKSTPFDIDPRANEHFEDWPGGRYNHYYHDLNRDLAWLSQIESQQRLPEYLSWMPQIHVDFHEQGVDSPYYFAPAVEPYHEVLTDFQREFQITIGKNHARYFDEEGWLYFTDDVFDLLYPGYGDTYPMLNGGIGMTYEQGGSGRAGLGILNSVGDVLSLKDRIAHHYTSGLSTVEVAYNNVARLNQEFQAFHAKQKGKYAHYVLSGNDDKLKGLKDLLAQHQIPVKALAQDTNIKGIEYSNQKTKSTSFSSGALVINGNDKKSRLIQALFEPRTAFSDSLTYDITSWSLPYAHGLKAIATNQKLTTVAFNEKTAETQLNPKAYAYAAERKSLTDGKFLAGLMKAGLRVYYNSVPLTNGGKLWDRGSVFVLRGENRQTENLAQTIENIAAATGQEVTALASGFSDAGPDLGSNKMQFISNRKVGILKSDQATPAAYGEVWHFFEQQLHYPIRQLSEDRLTERFLNELDVLIVPSGYYGNLLDNEGKGALMQWIRKGGRVVAIGNAVRSFANHDGFSLTRKDTDEEEAKTPYGDQERESIRSSIYGSIYKATVDATHPLAAGYSSNYFSLKTRATAYNLLEGYGTVAYLPKNAQPFAGFSGDKAIKAQSESLLVGTERYGRGSVVYLVDNPLYRNFWENGKLWLVNAIFM